MDGIRSWNELPKRDRYRRLDVTIKDLPALDDTTQIPLLKSLALNDARLRKNMPGDAHRLFATLFYFELTEVPYQSGASFSVKGNFLCTRKSYDRALPRITQRLLDSIIIVNGKETSSSPGKDLQGNIYQPISCVTGDILRIELRIKEANHPYPISGSPYKVQRLVSRGGLTTYFGNSTHKRKATDVISTQQPRKRRR